MTRELLETAKEIDKELKELKDLFTTLSDHKTILINAGCGFIKNCYCTFSDEFHKELLNTINSRINVLEEKLKNL